MEFTKKQIGEVLNKYGIPLNLSGFEYLVDTVKGCLDGTLDMRSMTKSVYPEVAKLHDTTASRAERAIRHAIDRAYGYKKTSLMLERFEQRPVNSEFIARVVYDLKWSEEDGTCRSTKRS